MGQPQIFRCLLQLAQFLLGLDFERDLLLSLVHPCFPPFLVVYKSVLRGGYGCVACLGSDFAFAHLQISAEYEDLFVFEFVGHVGSCFYVGEGDFKGLQRSYKGKKFIVIVINVTMMSEEEISQVINYPNEERHLEFKGPVSWDGDIKAKITKSIMALANLKDGGWIVIGKAEQQNRIFEIVGLSDLEFQSFDPDEIKAFVYSHVEPPVKFEVLNREVRGKKLVSIKVDEFSEMPIICKRSYNTIIHAGQIYVRSKGKPESIPVPSDSEMREIIENCVDKEVCKFHKRLHRTGIWAPKEQAEEVNDEEEFNKQLEGLL